MKTLNGLKQAMLNGNADAVATMLEWIEIDTLSVDFGLWLAKYNRLAVVEVLLMHQLFPVICWDSTWQTDKGRKPMFDLLMAHNRLKIVAVTSCDEPIHAVQKNTFCAAGYLRLTPWDGPMQRAATISGEPMPEHVLEEMADDYAEDEDDWCSGRRLGHW